MENDVNVGGLCIYMVIFFGILPVVRGILARSFIKSLDEKIIETNKLIICGRYRFKNIEKLLYGNMYNGYSPKNLTFLIKCLKPKYMFMTFVSVNIIYVVITFFVHQYYY